MSQAVDVPQGSGGGGGDKWPRRGPYRCGGCGMMPKKTACICIKSGTTPPSGSSPGGLASSITQLGTSPGSQYSMNSIAMSNSGMPMLQHMGGGGPLPAPSHGGARFLGRPDGPIGMPPMTSQMSNPPGMQQMLPKMEGGMMGLHQRMAPPMPMDQGPMPMHPSKGGGVGQMSLHGVQDGLGGPQLVSILPSTQQAVADLANSAGGAATPSSPMGRAARCGHCRTCSNPRLKKACLTVRQQQQAVQRQHSGSTGETSPCAVSTSMGGLSVAGSDAGMQQQGDMGAHSTNAVSRPPGAPGGPLLMGQPVGYRPGLNHALMPQMMPQYMQQQQQQRPSSQQVLPKMSRSISVPSITQLEWMQSGGYMGSTPVLDHTGMPITTYQQPSLMGDEKLASMPEEVEAGDWSESAIPDFADGEMLGSSDLLEGAALKRMFKGFGGGMSKAESMPNLSQLDQDDEDLSDPFEYDDDALVGPWGKDLTLERFGAEGATNNDIMDIDKDDLQPLGDMVRYFNMTPTPGEGSGGAASGENPGGGGRSVADAALVIPPAVSTAPSAAGVGGSSTMRQVQNIPNLDLAKQMQDAQNQLYLAEQNNNMFLTNMARQNGSPVPPQFTGMQPGMQGMVGANMGLVQCTQARGMEHLSAKRISRIMANRLSAAKSRVKKLQHTADLEARVKELQTSVEDLRPKISELQKEQHNMKAHNQMLKERLQAARERAAHQEGSINKLQHSIQVATSMGDNTVNAGGPSM